MLSKTNARVLSILKDALGFVFFNQGYVNTNLELVITGNAHLSNGFVTCILRMSYCITDDALPAQWRYVVWECEHHLILRSHHHAITHKTVYNFEVDNAIKPRSIHSWQLVQRYDTCNCRGNCFCIIWYWHDRVKACILINFITLGCGIIFLSAIRFGYLISVCLKNIRWVKYVYDEINLRFCMKSTSMNAIASRG